MRALSVELSVSLACLLGLSYFGDNNGHMGRPQELLVGCVSILKLNIPLSGAKRATVSLLRYIHDVQSEKDVVVAVRESGRTSAAAYFPR